METSVVLDAGAIGEEGLDEGGLALAVAAHEDDLVAAHEDGGGEVGDDVLDGAVLLLVGLVDVLELEDVLAGGAEHVEADKGALRCWSGRARRWRGARPLFCGS